jgi:hypothetical protein
LELFLAFLAHQCDDAWLRLSPEEPAERAKLAECGYIDTDERHPPIRLACQTQAFGRVIPPWNGVLSRARKMP